MDVTINPNDNDNINRDLYRSTVVLLYKKKEVIASGGMIIETE